jgi:hypothetical protein
MAMTAGDVLVETLLEWDVDTLFGIPGDGINGIVEALRQRQDRIRFIQTRHEESAAFMACAYAKFTGKLGVCLATSGPGGVHLLNGLYDAKLDGAPVLAITGMQFHDLIGTHTQQDVELDKLFMDVAVYNTRIMGGAHVRNAVGLACRTALARRGVAHVTMPVDMQSEPAKADERSERNVRGHQSDLFARGALEQVQVQGVADDEVGPPFDLPDLALLSARQCHAVGNAPAAHGIVRSFGRPDVARERGDCSTVSVSRRCAGRHRLFAACGGTSTIRTGAIPSSSSCTAASSCESARIRSTSASAPEVGSSRDQSAWANSPSTSLNLSRRTAGCCAMATLYLVEHLFATGIEENHQRALGGIETRHVRTTTTSATAAASL